MEVFVQIIMILAWAVLAVLNLWVWQKGKAQGNLLMLIGSAIETLTFFIFLVSKTVDSFAGVWLPLGGMVVFVIGFYLSVQPMVAAHVNALKKKVQDVAHKGEGEGS